MRSARLRELPLTRNRLALNSYRSTTRIKCVSYRSASGNCLTKEREEIKQEAAAMTRSLYRTCIRSVRVIRQGNEHDEAEFRKREEDEMESSSKSGRVSMISMLPPVDRDDELRSRSEYYLSYARENFVQESDCLDFDKWNRQQVLRFLHYLKNGDEQRKWLLADMRFKDPFTDAFDGERVKAFENRAMQHIMRLDEAMNDSLPAAERSQMMQQPVSSVQDENSEEEYSWTDDEEEEDGTSPPEWLHKYRGH
jgi:hypothetical protein|uniref:Uncharacterized protein n=1 Tax=Phaeodactylum tricornutum TaxID=2850 RepID=A0A8J9SEJ0_PHATR